MLYFSCFQVVCVVHNFKGKQLLDEDPPQDHLSNNPMVSSPRVESPLEKYIASQVQNTVDKSTLGTMLSNELPHGTCPVCSVESALKGPNCVSLSARINKMCIRALLSLRWQNWEWMMRTCRPALWKTVSWVSLAGSQAKAAASDTCRAQGNKRMRTCVRSSSCQSSGVQRHIIKTQSCSFQLNKPITCS